MTHGPRGGVDECDACAVALACVQEAAQEHQAPRHQLDKATVADQVGKGTSPVGQHAQGIKLFEGTKTRAGKGDGDRHHFAQAEAGLTAPFSWHRW